MESDMLVLDRLIIVCKADIEKIKLLFSLKALKIIIAESPGDLSCSVGTEIEEHDGILILDHCHRLSVFFDNGRFYELIRDALIIGSLYCLCSISPFDANTFCQGIIGKVYPVPSVITVHRIIAPGNNTDLADTKLVHLCLKLLDEAFS